MNKKLIALVLAFALVFSSFSAAFAETALPADAQAAKDLGMLIGNGSGVTVDYLKENPTRLTAALMFLRLQGLESAALSYTGTENFADAKDVAWAQGRNVMAYLKANKDLGWVGTTGNMFKPNDKIDAQSYYKVMLEALGYKANTTEVIGDFTWNQVFTFAASKGLTKVANVTNFVVNDIATATMEALKATVAGSTTQTLAAKLVDAKVIDAVKAAAAGVYTPATVALAVESVTATNLKEIVVKFNKAVDKTTAETAGNYVFTTTGPAVLGTPVLQADGKTVVLPLTTAAANQNTIDIKIQNVKDAAGTAITTVTKTVTLLDVSIPEALSYAFTGPTTIEVTFSEPVTSAGSVLIDNGIFGASAAIHATKKNVVVVTLGSQLPEGTHTLKVTGATDAVPYTALDKVFNITYTKDTTLPTVSVSAATQKKVTLKFNKEVKGDALTTTRFYHTYTSYTPVAVTDSLGNAINAANYYDTVIVDFTNNPLPAGTTNVVVLKTVASVLITDRYGNAMAADTTLQAAITADTTAPTVTKVEATNESTVVVTFSEDVTGAGTKANYVFKKADGTVIATTAYGNPNYVAGTTYTATFTFTPALAGGAYSVEVSNLKDNSLTANAMVMVPKTFTVSDKTPIAAATAVTVENTGSTADVIYVTFPESMSVTGANSVLNKANYKIGNSGAANAASAVALPTAATIELFGSNNIVKVTLPGTGGADLTGKSLFVTNLADASSNVMTAIYLEIAPTADAAPVVTAVKSVAKNTFAYTVNKQLSTINAADFTVGGVAVAQATYVNNSNGTATITIIVPAAQALANEGAIPANLAIVGTNTKSITGTAMAVDADILVDGDAAGPEVAVTAVDGIAPIVSSVVFVNATTIEVRFAENLDANSIAAAGKNGFSVSGGTLTTALRTAGNVITLTGTGFTNDTDVTYTAGNITDDAAGTKNALASFTHTATLVNP